MRCVWQIQFSHPGKLNAGNPNTPLPSDGLQLADCLLSVKTLHRRYSGTCAVFRINTSSAANEILDML